MGMSGSAPSHLTELLQALPGMPAGDVPLAEIALALSALAIPKIDPKPYQDYLASLGPRVRGCLPPEADVNEQLAALKAVLITQEGFQGDQENYDDLQNANLIRVIERKRGLPITLAILYLHAAKGAGIDLAGLNFPGHFLLRLGQGTTRLIIDPFMGGTVLQAPDLRQLLKKLHGPGAELSADYYHEASPRDILIRLQNNVKKRQIEQGDYPAALRTIETMRLIDPDEFRLLLDAGVLYARVGEATRATGFLEEYLTHFPPGHPHRIEAEHLLATIRAQLN